MPVDLQDCFSEGELSQFNRRDIGKIKSLARVLLEERAIIKRQEQTSGNNTGRQMSHTDSSILPRRVTADEGDIHSYSLQFSPPGAMIDDPMMVQVEHSEEEGTTIQHMSDRETPPMSGEIPMDPQQQSQQDFMRQSMSGASKNSIIVEDAKEDEEESREESPVLERPH